MSEKFQDSRISLKDAQIGTLTNRISGVSKAIYRLTKLQQFYIGNSSITSDEVCAKFYNADDPVYGKFAAEFTEDAWDKMTTLTDIELEQAYDHYKNDPEFNRELTELLNNYAGRPSLLYRADKLTRELGGAKIYLKREDLNHTGSHKINNVLGQVLMAKKMGKTRVIAETGAGQHGVEECL